MDQLLPLPVSMKGKLVVITGAGGVLCSMFAEAVARAGARVALINRTYNKARIVADRIVAVGGEAIAYGADVLDNNKLAEVHNQILKELGPCDVLINGAGGNNQGATTSDEYYLHGSTDLDTRNFFVLDLKSIESVFNNNFQSAFMATQVFAKDMLGRHGCSVINVSSMNAYTPLTKIPAYSAAKAAVSNFTQWLAVYLSKTGIRVNAIAPGFFSTEQNRELLYSADGTPTQRTEKILAATPMGRFGESKELIGTLLYLLSPEASGFVTGVVIPVDGGFSAYSGV